MNRIADLARRALVFFREVQVELGKVHWPSRKETYAATVVVLVLTLIMATYLGIVDFAVSRVLQLFLRQG